MIKSNLMGLNFKTLNRLVNFKCLFSIWALTHTFGPTLEYNVAFDLMYVSNRLRVFFFSRLFIRLDLQLSEKIDVILSNWMGYMLLHENMLGSVIIAINRCVIIASHHERL
jgi:hypothetical protein